MDAAEGNRWLKEKIKIDGKLRYSKWVNPVPPKHDCVVKNLDWIFEKLNLRKRSDYRINYDKAN